MMPSHKLFAPRRVGVCGSSRDLPPRAVQFCRAVGANLAQDPNVVIVSGGTRQREDTASDNLATDWHIVHAAEEAIRADSNLGTVDERIETIVSDESGVGERFHIGTIRRARGKTREARRFSFVKSVDALFAVGGRGGTAQELALAMELGMPLLPVPTFGGNAEKFWRSYEGDLIAMLGIGRADAERWTAAAPAEAVDLRALAAQMVAALLKSLPRRCFIITPFSEDFAALYDFVIEPVVTSLGDSVVRLDRMFVPGDAGEQIHEGIRRCDYAVAVLDGLRPNVLYEIGLARAYGKPTILLNRAGTLGGGALAPFDLSMQQRLEYRTIDANLLSRLKSAITNLPTRPR